MKCLGIFVRRIFFKEEDAVPERIFGIPEDSRATASIGTADSNGCPLYCTVFNLQRGGVE